MDINDKKSVLPRKGTKLKLFTVKPRIINRNLCSTKYKLDNRSIKPKLSPNVIKTKSAIQTLNMKHSKSKIKYINAEDRWKILNEIDLYLSKDEDEFHKLDRPTLSGTCLDMCPEKERYMREYQGLFSEFERSKDKECDHRRAVKDYERCSADQKEPQPHELRPTEVLKRTMDYLLVSIVDTDISSDNSRKWYQFLWSRTRSIRKDITQQNLCNSTVVSIVECITRFHIFCSARLCEEDKDVFDSRLNDENLKNCLQTLKNLYSDMPIDSCPKEAEFRAYMIINQLDEGKVHGLSSKVFHSPEVTLALQIHQAYVTNNYVRFFNLVSKCDFILSCLLHRYFVSIRIQAFEVINKVYFPKRTLQSNVPLDKFTKLLGFDSVKDCGLFCEQMGSSVDYFKLIIQLSNIFDKSEIKPAFLVRRSDILVESKLNDYRLSYIFNGYVSLDPRPDCYLQDNQMNSFDTDGYFIGTTELPKDSKPIHAEIDKLPIEKNKYQTKGDFISDDEVEIETQKKDISIVIDDTEDYEEENYNIEDLEDYKNKDDTEDDDCYIYNEENEGTISSNNNIFKSSFKSNHLFTNKNSNIFGSLDSSKSSLIFENSFANNNFKLQATQNNLAPIEIFKESTTVPIYRTPSIQIDDKRMENIQIKLFDNIFENAVEIEVDKIFNSKVLNSICEEIYETLLTNTIEKNVTDHRNKMFSNLINEYSRDILLNILSDILIEFYQDIELDLIRDQINEDKINYLLMKRSLRKWLKFKNYKVFQRRSFTNLAPGPVNLDSYSICRNFHGEVRLIDSLTDSNLSCNYVDQRYPVTSILLNTPIEPSSNVSLENTSCQTTIINSNFRSVILINFIRKFIERRFIRIVNLNIESVERISKLHPSINVIISDYNRLIDKLNQFLLNSKVIIDISDLKLFVDHINLDLNFENWFNKVMDNLSLSEHQKFELMHKLNQLFIYYGIDYLKSDKTINYWLLCLVPWLNVVLKAVENIIDKLPYFIKPIVSLDISNIENIPITNLKLEDSSNQLTIDQCLKLCKSELPKQPIAHIQISMTKFESQLKPLQNYEKIRFMSDQLHNRLQNLEFDC